MTRVEPRWVPRLVIEAVHLDQIREHGGLIGIRDENALEAALARPRQRWEYDPESDLARLAAAYAFGVVAPEDEVVERMVALAAGDLDEEAVADWLRGRIKPRPGV